MTAVLTLAALAAAAAHWTLGGPVWALLSAASAGAAVTLWWSRLARSAQAVCAATAAELHDPPDRAGPGPDDDGGDLEALLRAVREQQHRDRHT